MAKKLYSISELINENIRLKKKIERDEKRRTKEALNFLYLIRDGKTLDIEKIIKGFEEDLK